MAVDAGQLRAYVEYLRDLGIWDLYRHDDAPPTELTGLAPAVSPAPSRPGPAASSLQSPVLPRPAAPPRPSSSPASVRPPARPAASAPAVVDSIFAAPPPRSPVAPSPKPPLAAGPVRPPVSTPVPNELEVEIPKPVSFDALAPLPEVRVRPEDREAALVQLRALIGDCTRCPLAYAGRRSIVFGDGDPRARLMFVGEGPGADEDTSGIPFVGKAGQLLNNMIGAMGLTREQVYIANIVKCRPPQNRVPEPVEANTCAQFLLEQIDIVQPEVIVALGATAATYLLGVKQSLTSLRGEWRSCRGAKVAVTFHPAYLLRDPRQKGEAWKDLQRVMQELGLRPPAKA